MKIDVCIETFFSDLPWQERILKIGALGFSGIEIWHPEATFDGSTLDTSMPKDPSELKEVAAKAGVTPVSFVINGWDGAFGGSPLHRDEHKRFLDQVTELMKFAEASGVRSAIIMPGIVDDTMSFPEMKTNSVEAFRSAADIAAKHQVTLNVEPLNTEIDHPGFLFATSDIGMEIVDAVDRNNVKLLYDIYHMQIMEGNVVSHMKSNLPRLGHVHIAGVPGRQEPDQCELNYRFIIEELVSSGYDGWFGLEYFPGVDSGQSLQRQLEAFR